MSDMVKKVRRAIAVAQYGEGAFADSVEITYTDAARAAIRAFMEPTPEAILTSGYSKEHWRAIATAALGEED